MTTLCDALLRGARVLPVPFAGPFFDGRVGLTVDGGTRVLVLVDVRSIRISRVGVMRADDGAPTVAVDVVEHVRRVPLRRGVHVLDLGSPGPDWQSGGAVPFDVPGQRLTVVGSDRSGSGGTNPLTVTSAQVAALRPGQVLVSDGDTARVVTRQAFGG